MLESASSPTTFIQAMFPITCASYTPENKSRSDVIEFFDDKDRSYDAQLGSSLGVFDYNNSETDFGILYANTVTRGIYAEEVFVMIISSILSTSKSGLPVGEIGKLLQDIVSFPNLSAFLKDTFGGLKKFMDNHFDVFIVCNDHPFNPTAMLVSQASNNPTLPSISVNTQLADQQHGGSGYKSPVGKSKKSKKRQNFPDNDIYIEDPANMSQFQPFLPSSTILQMPPFIPYSPLGNQLPFQYPEAISDSMRLPPPNFPQFMLIPPNQQHGPQVYPQQDRGNNNQR